MVAAQPCDIHLHIPFVIAPCPYLEGTFSPHTQPAVKLAYMQSLMEELKQFVHEGVCPRSITIGGGAATTIDEHMFAVLEGGLREVYSYTAHNHTNHAASSSSCPPSGSVSAPVLPVSVSADPGLLSSAALARFAGLGANRIIMRYFTSDPREADVLGMPCAGVEMQKTQKVIECSSVQNIDMQVLIGIPGQTGKTLIRTLDDAAMSRPVHFELLPYGLDASQADANAEESRLFEIAAHWLEAHGYQAYTASCFVLVDRVDSQRINEVHRWNEAAELNLGAGTTSAFDGMLWSTTADIDVYIEHANDPAAITVAATAIDETAARLRAQFAQLYQLSSIPFDARWQSLVDEGLLMRKGDQVCLSGAGRLRYHATFARMA